MIKTLETGAELRVLAHYTDRTGKRQGPIRPLGQYFWAPDTARAYGPVPVWDRHGRVVFFMLRQSAFYSDLVAEVEAPKRR
ncbi:hypothetical protein D2T29_22175 [Sinirhodobacter populi]|uniref:Uncharacterized protein n=1 Tax=Paenirhodobacter populi TaxID=2306993 RepID=A0A443JXT7_9RHOB|nr:hypothetical protein [Sinirhodobacter populi]RWR25295.1 hypothetical protein D2T29_22175 [Sinirhodobacter populi]